MSAGSLGALLPESARAMRRCAVALVHHPVLDGSGAIVTTAVTNLDVHDLARSARTFGCTDYFVVHPIAAQRELVKRIRDHWTEGSGGRRIPDRREALGILRIVESLDVAFEQLGGRSRVEVWATAARPLGSTLTLKRRARVWRARDPSAHPIRNRLGSGAERNLSGRRIARADCRRGHPVQSPERAGGLRHRARPIVRANWSGVAGGGALRQKRLHLGSVGPALALHERGDND